jgi:hypothetical protein
MIKVRIKLKISRKTSKRAARKKLVGIKSKSLNLNK